MIVNRDYTNSMNSSITLKSVKKIGMIDPVSGQEKTVSNSSDQITVALPAGGATLYILA
ncbi:hypothetical protein SDC9_196984 [bioreactor metagenome]|uniref:Uncharacterized protein n=1 Tax=bioreactor metagenome TaxID=1076179 RepID=A0A645IM22_9ZZZZ